MIVVDLRLRPYTEAKKTVITDEGIEREAEPSKEISP
jgi:hypothetical protein